MKIAIDYDGVLIDHQDIPTSEKWWKDQPMKGAVDALWLLSKEHEVYICTAREEKDWPIIEQWMDIHGFPKLEITNKKKPNTDVYIDDRAYRFTNWNDIYKLFT